MSLTEQIPIQEGENRYHYLHRFFMPKSIALIGVSGHPDKWGFRIMANILAGGYQGVVYPVNPKGGSLLGLDVYSSMKNLPRPVDLAIVTVPAHVVPEVMREAAQRDIRYVIIISSGFSEIGADGLKLEKEVTEIAHRSETHFIGPNTMGIYSAKTSLAAMMPSLCPKVGGASCVSQSGNLGVQMLDWGGERGVGFSKFVSSGTEADIPCEAYIEYFAADADTKVIMVYIEGVKDGRKFLDTLSSAGKKKPIIVFKGGKGQEAARAARSHSGMIAGSYDVYNAVFRQAGVIQATTTDGILDYSAAFLHFPLPKGNRIGIVTKGGGWGVVTADACRQRGLQLASLSSETLRSIGRLLPNYWSHNNPVDMVATLHREAFPGCLEAIIRDAGVDGIIALGVESGRRTEHLADTLREMELIHDTGLQQTQDGAREIRLALDLMATYGKPIIMVSGLRSSARSVSLDGRETILFPTPERAAGAMAVPCEYAGFIRKETGAGMMEMVAC